MKVENAHFKPLDFYRENPCENLDGVLDFARCLEDTAYPVLTRFYGWDGSENESLPSAEEMKKHPVFDPADNNEGNMKTGWMMAKLELPYITKYFDRSQWGEYAFTYYSGLDMDIYCDEHPVQVYSYMGGRFDTGAFPDGNEHNIFIRIDSPNDKPVCDITSRYYLKGLEKTNLLISDLARSLRAGCHLLSEENRRDNLYVQGTVDINKSKLTGKDREILEKCLVDTANFVMGKIFENKLPECLEEGLKMLSPVREYAKKFTVYFIGHSHIDLAWKWRYPESIECMKGTFEIQLELMEREPEYVYVETSAVLWKDMKEKYPEFWKKIRAAADRGQFEPQGGMWCETDGQCVGAESWFRQIEKGQEAALDTCGKKSTCAMNIDAFGFNAGLPKILSSAGLNYFVTQKLRYNEQTLFPYIHFWWEGDDGSKVLTLHEYPGHANHIEIDELPKIINKHHLTDGFYHIPILWGYGNHGGGPLPVMMDRIEELKKQTVFPNIRFCGLTEFYEILNREEDLSTLPTVKGELFLETHQKTFTVQAKTKYLNRECERRLLNSECLQSSTGEYTDLSPAWEKQLFSQFHDVLAGTSMLKVYLDLYDDYDKAFDLIKKANEKCIKKAFGYGQSDYVFNPVSVKNNARVILEKDVAGDSGYIKDSRGNLHPWQKTFDGRIVSDIEMLPHSFEKLEITQGSPKSEFIVTENSVDNGIIKVTFDDKKGVITSLKYDGREFCSGSMGQLRLLEDLNNRDYGTWNFDLSGKEFDVKPEGFKMIENGPVRVVFRGEYSFVIWQEKKPYYGTYLWHTPGVEFPTSLFTQDFIIYKNSPVVYCVLNADWWEDKKDLKVCAETTVSSPKAFYQIPFGKLERPVKRDTPYEKARFEVPAITYADLEGDDGYSFALLNRSKNGYDTLNSRVRLTLLTSPDSPDRACVPDPTADRGKHRIEYAFLPHKTKESIEETALSYERGIMQFSGGDNSPVETGKSLLKATDDSTFITSARLTQDGKVTYRVMDKISNKLDLITE